MSEQEKIEEQEKKEQEQKEAAQKKLLVDLMNKQKKLETREKALVQQWTELKDENAGLKTQAEKLGSKGDDDANSNKASSSFAREQKFDIPERMALRQPEYARDFYRPLKCVKK